MTDEFNNPFEKLKKAKLDLPDADAKPGAKKRRKAAKTPPPEPAQNPYADQDALFLQAMGGAKPVARRKRDAALDHEPFGVLLEKDEKKRKENQEAANAAPAPTTAPAPGRAARKPAPEPAPIPDEEAAAFLSAMGDVAPMHGKGRDLPRESTPPEPVPGKSSDALAREHLRDLVRGDVEFELEFTTEYMHGHVNGLDPKIFNKLRAGAYSTEAHLDLHGMTSDEALMAVVDFIRRSYTMGKRHLLLVTGRGKNSPDGRGVLRDEVQLWLTREPLRRVVLAFVTAQPRDGGPGALYVLLRKFKKSLGKVQWDRLPKDWSTLE
jgi:DNA-nicking Smr family endonuclease